MKIKARCEKKAASTVIGRERDVVYVETEAGRNVHSSLVPPGSGEPIAQLINVEMSSSELLIIANMLATMALAKERRS